MSELLPPPGLAEPHGLSARTSASAWNLVPSPPTLLGRFIDFYAEVAREKRAAARHAPTADMAGLAAETSARLADFLERQLHVVRASATPAELTAYRELRKVMAALADELFLLELPWDGRAAWLGELLEARVCGSRHGGVQVFAYADRLIRAGQRGGADADAATILLLTLGLGFQGRLRGAEGQLHLAAYRSRLYRLAAAPDQADEAEPACAQAYRYCARLEAPRRRGVAPLLRALGWGAGLYLLLSALLWMWAISPLVATATAMPASG